MKNIPLRRVITYIGLIASVLIGVNIATKGYGGPIVGLIIIIFGPIISYFIGITAEFVKNKQ